ncbi:MAG: hypothetical protein FRX49_07900 [Trebouxia sp. A1-2]|nr:MAG: hypothetical protein FRX49_07900 [Trebouxia sp. A1-2]
MTPSNRGLASSNALTIALYMELGLIQLELTDDALGLENVEAHEGQDANKEQQDSGTVGQRQSSRRQTARSKDASKRSMAGVMTAARSYWATVACSSKLDLELRRLNPGRLFSSEFAPGESGVGDLATASRRSVRVSFLPKLADQQGSVNMVKYFKHGCLALRQFHPRRKVLRIHSLVSGNTPLSVVSKRGV